MLNIYKTRCTVLTFKWSLMLLGSRLTISRLSAILTSWCLLLAQKRKLKRVWRLEAQWTRGTRRTVLYVRRRHDFKLDTKQVISVLRTKRPRK